MTPATLVVALLTAWWCRPLEGAPEPVLSRRRRYLTFPEGSSMQLVYCLTVPTLIPNTIFNYGWTAGVAWELPSDAAVLLSSKRKGANPMKDMGPMDKPTQAPIQYMDYYYVDDHPHQHEVMLHRRHRRDVFAKLEPFLEVIGMAGRSCILRALCETGQRAGPNGSFMDEILHAIFRFPAGDATLDDEDLSHYDAAHQSRADCADLYTDCPVSIHELGLYGDGYD